MKIVTYSSNQSSALGLQINGEIYSLHTIADNMNDFLALGDSAMHQAKERGKNRIQYFKEYMKDVIITNYGMGQSLKEAVNKNQWEIYYQPQIDFTTNKIIGFEALIRWNHPEKGLIMPSSFIPTAETNDSIFEIGEYVLKAVCNQTSIWNKEKSNWTLAGGGLTIGSGVTISVPSSNVLAFHLPPPNFGST